MPQTTGTTCQNGCMRHWPQISPMKMLIHSQHNHWNVVKLVRGYAEKQIKLFCMFLIVSMEVKEIMGHDTRNPSRVEYKLEYGSYFSLRCLCCPSANAGHCRCMQIGRQQTINFQGIRYLAGVYITVPWSHIAHVHSTWTYCGNCKLQCSYGCIALNCWIHPHYSMILN